MRSYDNHSGNITSTVLLKDKYNPNTYRVFSSTASGDNMLRCSCLNATFHIFQCHLIKRIQHSCSCIISFIYSLSKGVKYSATLAFFYNFISKYPHLYISKQYILHTFIIYFERERDRGFIQYFSFIITLHLFNYQLTVWVTYLVWCKSTSAFVTFITSRLIVGIRIGTYV